MNRPFLALPVVLCAALLAVAGCSGDGASTTTASTATTTPAAALGDLVWSRIDDEAVFGATSGDEVVAVAAAGPGLVAVGHLGTPIVGVPDPTVRVPEVWVSGDGYSWTLVPIADEPFGTSRYRVMSSVTAGGPGVVAAGWEADGYASNAAVWVSADGYTWRHIEDRANLGGKGYQRIFALTVGGPGLVAVGYEDRQWTHAAVWTSADGLAWTRVPHDPVAFGVRPHVVKMLAVTAGGPGLVAVGTDWVQDEGSDAVVWVSEDGQAWSRIPDPEGVFGGPGDQEMVAVTAGGPGLVAVGSVADGAAVWVSPDGYRWARVADAIPQWSEGGGRIRSVVTAGSGLVAVGDAPKAWGYEVGAVWFSADGYTWTRYPDPDGALGPVEVCPEPGGPGWESGMECSAGVNAVTLGGPGLVAGGYAASGGDLAAAVWVAAPPHR